MTAEDRARRWLSEWVPGHGEAAVKSLTHELAVAQAEALLEGLKSAEETAEFLRIRPGDRDPAWPEDRSEQGERGPQPDVPHEPWPNRHNTPTGQSWFRNESDVDSWP